MKNPSNVPDRLGFSRRYFLSLPVFVGGMVMLNEPLAAARVDLSAAFFIQENVSVSDSVALYTNLLPDIRKAAFDKTLRKIGLLKQLASGRLDILIESARNFDSKYRDNTTSLKPETLADFRQLINEVEDTWQIRDAVDRSRNELPRLADVDSKVDSVHDHLLKASEYFTKAKDDLKNETRKKSVADGKAELKAAIGILKGFLKNEIDEADLNSPVERLILLLRGVEFSVDKDKPSTSMNSADSNQKAIRSHHAMTAPASSIMQVLRRHVTPGSWLQLGIGYAVAFPVLLRNSNSGIREKLLMDGLRLVPGLVPAPLVSAARELAGLSL